MAYGWGRGRAVGSRLCRGHRLKHADGPARGISRRPRSWDRSVVGTPRKRQGRSGAMARRRTPNTYGAMARGPPERPTARSGLERCEATTSAACPLAGGRTSIASTAKTSTAPRTRGTSRADRARAQVGDARRPRHHEVGAVVFVDDRIGSDRDGGRLHVVGAGGRVVGSGVGRAHAHDVEGKGPVDRVVRDVQPSRE